MATVFPCYYVKHTGVQFVWDNQKQNICCIDYYFWYTEYILFQKFLVFGNDKRSWRILKLETAQDFAIKQSPLKQRKRDNPTRDKELRSS